MTFRNTSLATVGGFGAILLWSTTIAVTRSLAERLGPASAAAAVCAVSGSVALISFLRHKHKRQLILQLPPKYLAGCGTLFVAYTAMIIFAIGWASDRQVVLEVGLLNYLWPTLTLVLSLVFLGKKAGWVLVPGTLLALAGVFLVVTSGEVVSWQSLARNFANNPVSYSLALAAAVSWALYSSLTRRWAGEREVGAVALFLPATAVVLFLICCFLDEPRDWSPRAFTETLFLGVSTYVAYTLWDNAMRRGNVVLIAAASYLTPLFSTIVSSIYLAVVPGARLWVGCIVLVLGSVLSWKSVSSGKQ